MKSSTGLARAAVAIALASACAAPALAAAPPAKVDAWRPIDAANTLVIDTNKGRIIVELYPTVAPNTVARIEQLTRLHFYDGLSFFRVVDGFMDQTGDPQNTGAGASNFPNVKAEFSFKYNPANGLTTVLRLPETDLLFVGALPVLSQPQAMAQLTADGQVLGEPLFCAGVIGMARAQDPDSGNSQFFLMRADNLSLDQKYAAFGRVIEGQKVVQAIKTGEPPPPPADTMVHVQILADMPPDQRPNLRIADTTSPGFKAMVAEARKAKGDDFNPCAIEVPVEAAH